MKLISDEEIKDIQKSNYARGLVGFTKEQIEIMVGKEGTYKERKIAQKQLDSCEKEHREIVDGVLNYLQDLIELSSKVREPSIKVKMMDILQSLKKATKGEADG